MPFFLAIPWWFGTPISLVPAVLGTLSPQGASVCLRGPLCLLLAWLSPPLVTELLWLFHFAPWILSLIQLYQEYLAEL